MIELKNKPDFIVLGEITEESKREFKETIDNPDKIKGFAVLSDPVEKNIKN